MYRFEATKSLTSIRQCVSAEPSLAKRSWDATCTALLLTGLKQHLIQAEHKHLFA